MVECGVEVVSYQKRHQDPAFLSGEVVEVRKRAEAGAEEEAEGQLEGETRSPTEEARARQAVGCCKAPSTNGRQRG